MIDDWPFEDPPNMAVITTVNVLEHGHPVLLVTHDEDDGGWRAWRFSAEEPWRREPSG